MVRQQRLPRKDKNKNKPQAEMRKGKRVHFSVKKGNVSMSSNKKTRQICKHAMGRELDFYRKPTRALKGASRFLLRLTSPWGTYLTRREPSCGLAASPGREM